MITDDIALISVDDCANPKITPSFPATRLRRDALVKLGRENREHTRLRKNVEKYILPVENFHYKSAKIHKIFVLDIHEKSEISTHKLNYADSFYWLSYFTFRKRFYTGLGLDKLHFRLLSGLLESTSVIRVSRPDAGYFVDELVDTITQEIHNPVEDQTRVV